MTKHLLVAAAAAALSLPAFSASINISTGLDASDTLITTNGTADAHWVATNPGGGAAAQVITSSGSDWYSGWLANGPNSDWIARDASTSNNGTGTYSITFDLTGTDLSTATITGSWGIDDNGTLDLNGNVISSLGGGLWGALTPFSVTAGSPFFNQGLNTLSMTITSSDNFLEAVRLEGTVTAADVVSGAPEPATMTLIGAGLCAVALVRRRLVKK